MIIQTGLRTDIPAFYSEWFINRIKQGFVYVRNPYNPLLVTSYSLSADVVDLISFCTKNPAPMLPHMDMLKPYGQFWFVTITPYGRDIEPNVPLKETVIEDFKRLSDLVGTDCIGWRYDPIFISDTYSVERHIADFEFIAGALAGYTKTCVISFIDLYQKVKRNFPTVQAVEKNERMTIGKAFAEIGQKHHITIKACGEGTALEESGIDCRGCMTIATYENALHGHLNAPRRKPARKECACFLGNDIGCYNTCGHLCKYCYANYDEKIVHTNMLAHNPEAPLLLGDIQPEDTIHPAKQERWLDMQLRLDLF